jgi:hypothetical protein
LPSTPDLKILIRHQNLEIWRKGTWNPTGSLPLLFLTPALGNMKKLW